MIDKIWFTAVDVVRLEGGGGYPCPNHVDAGIHVLVNLLFCSPCGHRTDLPNTWMLR